MQPTTHPTHPTPHGLPGDPARGFGIDPASPIGFLATNVTGTQSVDVRFDPALTAGAVADAIAARMALPNEVPWALRDDDSSAYLDDGQPIGSQITPGSRVTITPRAHLGAAARGAR